MKIKVLRIIGRKWFEKRNGNTYHTFEVRLNGHDVYRSGLMYGYGSMYLQNACVWLKEKGILPKDCNSIWAFCNKNNICVYQEEFKTPRKKDLLKSYDNFGHFLWKV